MGFLKKFFRNVFHEDVTMQIATTNSSTSSFEQIDEAALEAHLGVSRYGDFVLSDAVRPAFDLEVVPTAGFRHDVYRDESSRQNVPVLMASVSKERLFDTFMELLDPLGPSVDVVLETSHDYSQAGHQDLYREHIDMPILQSILWDYEEMLVNDGCTGIAVLNPGIPQEVQLDEHKLMIVYGKELREYEDLLIDAGVPCRDEMQFITEAEHVHSTNDDHIQQFEELKMRLGIDSMGY